MRLFRKGAPEPGFCEKCGSPKTSIEVRPKRDPYSHKSGSLMTTEVFACSDGTCPNGKVRGEFKVRVGYDEWGEVRAPFVWTGIPFL